MVRIECHDGIRTRTKMHDIWARVFLIVGECSSGFWRE